MRKMVTGICQRYDLLDFLIFLTAKMKLSSLGLGLVCLFVCLPLTTETNYRDSKIRKKVSLGTWDLSYRIHRKWKKIWLSLRLDPILCCVFFKACE